jgi:hypothetical protein
VGVGERAASPEAHERAADAGAAVAVDDRHDELRAARDGERRHLGVERGNGAGRRGVLRRAAARGGRSGDEDDDR